MMILSIIFAAALGLTNCSGSDNDATSEETITLSQSTFSVDTAAQVVSVNVKTTHEFSAYTNDSWITVSPASSVSKDVTLSISIAANRDTVQRAGKVTIVSGTSRSVITITQAKGEAPKITGPAGYSLVWNDEFEGNSLGSSWTYEIQNAGWVNNELQKYVNDGAVTTVSDGKLKINLMKSNGVVNSARIYAKKSTGWKYGYVEARIKLPAGTGTWPAFWMMPVNFKSWPADGEIDIMEEVGFNPNVIVSTIHCNKYNNGGTSIESGNKKIPTAQSDFHVYALLWTATSMTFYVDGTSILTYNNDGTGVNAWPFDNPFYVILNLAWGGSWGGMKGVDETALPASMEVDYVRVFQKK
jgi:hypothetical protein